MAKVIDIYNIINDFAPCSLKEEWDNVGLLIGSENTVVKNVMIALDCTNDVVREAVKKDCHLIITHHPVIFDEIKKIDYDSSFGEKLSLLIKNKISVISMHTNLDKATGGVNDTLLSLLEVENVSNLTDEIYSLGRKGTLKREMKLIDFVKFVKDKLNVTAIKYIGDDNKIIKNIASVCGSGSDMIEFAKDSDVFLTSEIKHHIGIYAKENNIALIDAGHFETENPVCNTLKKLICDKTDLKVYITEEFTEVFKTI